MKKLTIVTISAILAVSAACGAKTETGADKANSAAPENKAATTAPAGTGAASAVVKEVYGKALKRECAAIPPMLTEEFRKEVGTTQLELDSLCDTFTDSGKLTSFEVKSEDLKGDSGTVKVALTYKDGKKEDKDENVKKSGDKWLVAP